MALANIIVGIILGRLRTRQGKARPLLFTAALLLLISGLLMFLILTQCAVSAGDNVQGIS